ncbi:AraC family transcriptional regulator [Vibrio penaeicida]|uniref:AraC family transcriptional regulator n=1 Tax=Vibrio penaeicida TaxID=104609 RepID=A0AAV5NV25_9VIBR|nr:helix-turn-helix domain-containing protein [Vibrio penaeicida]RTZ21647.1 AraC family transcriptional regulator [Vibrio penaeicida]GLQ74394.1 AraC family transcriptional regulator [Vibrio penaeicida]
MTFSVNSLSASSWQVYSERLEPVLAYIHQHLDRPLTLEKAAELSHFSKYHFQRIFSAIIGESLSQYSNRLRLEKAANALLFHESLSITDIAMQFGFSSSANFSRSFKDHFGITPYGVKSGKPNSLNGVKTPLKQPIDTAILQHIHTLRAEAKVCPPSEAITPDRIFESPDIELCSLRSEDGYLLPSIFQCWNTLIDWGLENDIGAMDQVRLAMCHDNLLFTPREKCRYDAALMITPEQRSKIHEPFELGKLNAGRYAAFRYQGKPDNAAKFQISLYAKWLPYSGYEPDIAPLIERYDRPISSLDKDGKPEWIDLEVWIKIKPLRTLNELSGGCYSD